jgi:hypothetical protein
MTQLVLFVEFAELLAHRRWHMRMGGRLWEDRRSNELDGDDWRRKPLRTANLWVCRQFRLVDVGCDRRESPRAVVVGHQLVGVEPNPVVGRKWGNRKLIATVAATVVGGADGVPTAAAATTMSTAVHATAAATVTSTAVATSTSTIAPASAATIAAGPDCELGSSFWSLDCAARTAVGATPSTTALD